MTTNSRLIAAKIIQTVIERHCALDEAVASMNRSNLSERDQRFVNNLCYGTIRWYFQLVDISNLLLHKALPAKHRDVLCLLLIGFYQLIYLETPAYAAISETVNAIKKIKKPWAAGLANKVLRVFCERKCEILSKMETMEAYAHPDWLVKRLQKDWPEDWKAILEANNHQAPISLRINPQFQTKSDYLKQLSEKNIAAHELDSLPFGIQLDEAVNIRELPGFNQGWCYIQDEAGQHVAPLLQLEPEITLLDACCAPGSKTTDILLSMPEIAMLVAVDKDKKRLGRVKENTRRLQIVDNKLQLIHGDVQKIKESNFDRILVDAPCSATGVIRRHPDIKILRQAEDIDKQVKQQQLLLESLWQKLKPGGLLLYTTCSVLKAENENNIADFLAKHTDAKLAYQNQLFPQINGHDGFFYAKLKKV